MNTFDDWMYELEINGGCRADRLAAIFDSQHFRIIEKWLEAAYNQGREDERGMLTHAATPDFK